jgi:hypothetical protein
MLKGQVLGEVTAPDRLQKEGKCLGADEVRGDDLMPRTDLDASRDHVQKRGGIDHVAGSSGILGACLLSQSLLEWPTGRAGCDQAGPEVHLTPLTQLVQQLARGRRQVPAAWSRSGG